ncbi:hypothetical protein KAS41_03895 [Candidatus Parcubacteria bacterium]|nr:hypothetical protein [Candidatus Parcubacteria bacterium]
MINQLKKIIKNIPNNELSRIISSGALKLDDDIIDTISFVFWICFMAEQDLKNIEYESLRIAKIAYPEGINEKNLKIIEEEYGIRLHKIDPNDKNHLERNIYFSDLIKIKEKLFGKKNITKLLWKLNNIRNDLSHGRIDNLKYNSESLFLHSTKKRLLIDYFTLSAESDIDNSPIWKKLTSEEKKEIKNNFNKITKN